MSVGKIQLRTPKAKFTAQRRCICPAGQKARNKRQRQETEGEGNEGEREGVFVLGVDKKKNCLWIKRRKI